MKVTIIKKSGVSKVYQGSIGIYDIGKFYIHLFLWNETPKIKKSTIKEIKVELD